MDKVERAAGWQASELTSGNKCVAPVANNRGGGGGGIPKIQRLDWDEVIKIVEQDDVVWEREQRAEVDFEAAAGA